MNADHDAIEPDSGPDIHRQYYHKNIDLLENLAKIDRTYNQTGLPHEKGKLDGHRTQSAKVIRLTKHATEAMDTRNISFEWVERTLRFPGWTNTDPRHPDRMHAFKAIPEFGGRFLRVVFRTDGADIIVITVHPDRNAKR